MISNFKNYQRVFLQVNIPGFPNNVQLVRGHFGQNDQKLRENQHFWGKTMGWHGGQGKTFGKRDPGDPRK